MGTNTDTLPLATLLKIELMDVFRVLDALSLVSYATMLPGYSPSPRPPLGFHCIAWGCKNDQSCLKPSVKSQLKVSHKSRFSKAQLKSFLTEKKLLWEDFHLGPRPEKIE